ncbi:AAA family ATPase [Tenacibaculum holothuriorum]|uniref:AAA family ATPase n=1 Tax=Tenacibaculum holothuriorum TaxID=1635173 RepID=UPI000A32A2DB|nr:AAA family ATPase [Tenacibaculum holothuriorum]
MSSKNITIRSKEAPLTLDKIHLSNQNQEATNQLLDEFTYYSALKKYSLPINNKILFHGHTGCGKTATARAISKALNKEIFVLNLGNFVSSKLGETSKNIAEIFKRASLEKAILFIDEFDFIGKTRDYDTKDSGEMKRLVNTVIQQIDHLNNDTLLIAATNYVEVIDTALLRRFEVQLKFDLPKNNELDIYYDELVAKFPKEFQNIKRSYNISYAEAKNFTLKQIKKKVIDVEKSKTTHLLFSYGTLQLEKVQKETYGRLLHGKEDILKNYTVQNLEINNKEVLDRSGQKFHPIAIKTNQSKDKITGTIFEISEQELIETDKYEVDAYQRVLETFVSGKKAWIYIAK